MTRRQWVIGTLCLLPIVAAIGAFALPPMDEYTALDRLGKPMDATEYELLSYRPEQRAQVLEWKAREERENPEPQPPTRVWVVTAPEAEVAKLLGKFTSHRREWQRNGGGVSNGGNPHPGGTTYAEKVEYFVNDETTDTLTNRVRSYHPGHNVERTIQLEQTVDSRKPWPRFRRWLHLAFAGM